MSLRPGPDQEPREPHGRVVETHVSTCVFRGRRRVQAQEAGSHGFSQLVDARAPPSALPARGVAQSSSGADVYLGAADVVSADGRPPPSLTPPCAPHWSSCVLTGRTTSSWRILFKLREGLSIRGPTALVPPVVQDEYNRMTQRDLETLSPDECFDLLGQASIGRLVYTDEEGPVALPVNYAMAGQAIVIRVEGGTKRAAIGQPALAFEVDDIDNPDQTGWSVIARGTGQEVAIEDVPGLLRELAGHPPRPWAEGVHNVWLRITPRASPVAV